ncbi:MAG: hypothetical protein IJM79_08455 [Erysipelotrichaceae bacterium]|nr:hypothetical protein [Erysipelotrichaceae bacterium]
MKEPLKILKAMNDIDDDLIMEANEESYGRERKPFLNLDFRRLAPVMAVMVLAVALTVTQLGHRGDVITGGYEIPAESLAEAERIASFPISVPESAGDQPIGKIGVIENTAISVYYGDEENVSVIIVKGKGSEDVSGDYNEYAERSVISLESREVTLEGNGALICKAIWTDGQFSYAVLAPEGLSLDDIKPIIKATE